MSTATATRTVDGRTVPTAGSYQIDPTHSSLELIARHLVVTKVRSRFTSWTAELTIAEDPTQSSLNVTIDVASFQSGDDHRDGHVKSADFFDVEAFPTATFRSTSIRPAGGDDWNVVGDLTIKDVTAPVTLQVTFGGAVTDPFGNTKVLFAAEGELDREAWGITWNAPLETGGVLIGKKIVLELEVQAVPA